MDSHIYCRTCGWIGSQEECLNVPTGKYVGETRMTCPKCQRAVTFSPCPPPLEFPTCYPADLLELPALSIRQPWAWLVASGFKSYENRDWAAKNPGRKFRGRFLIHAATGGSQDDYLFDVAAAQRCYRDMTRGGEIEIPPRIIMPRGCLIGVATITDWHDSPPREDAWAFTSGFSIEGAELFAPIECKGAMGFFRPARDELERRAA